MSLHERHSTPPSSQGAQRASVVVQKYGGSSVADVAKLGMVADRIVATRRAGHDVVVVVSAMGKTTDDLLKLAREVAGGSATDGATNDASAAPRRELDMLVSTGERVAMSLLAIAVQARGCDAISFTGSQCGIITNDRHFDARIIEVRPHRIEDELARGRIVIVAGYQGMSYRREITTLGRGGTDTTAVALAAALQAERCEIYSDVDGVYSADPRAVAEAQHLPQLDYATLQEMSRSGAKVLCAQAVEWARRAGVVIYARSTFDPPSDKARQTVVTQLNVSDARHVRAITCDKRVALLELHEVARLSELLALASDIGLPLGQLNMSQERASILVPLTNAPNWEAGRGRLEAFGEALQIYDEVALLAVVGEGLTDDSLALAEFRQLIAEVGPPLAIYASPLRLAAVVEAKHSAALQRTLHERFGPKS